MSTLALSDGILRHLPVLCRQLEQIYGLVPGTIADSFPSLSTVGDMSELTYALSESDVGHLLEPTLLYKHDPRRDVVVELCMKLVDRETRLACLVLVQEEQGNLSLRGYGFVLNNINTKGVVLDLQKVNAGYAPYMEPAQQHKRLIIERALHAFPTVKTDVVAQVRDQVLSVLGASGGQVSVPAVVTSSFDGYRIAPAVLSGLPKLLHAIDGVISIVEENPERTLSQKWAARVASLGEEALTARDVSALFFGANLPVPVYMSKDETRNELSSIACILTFQNGLVLCLMLEADEGKLSLRTDFLLLEVMSSGRSVGAFDAKVLRVFQEKAAEDQSWSDYQQCLNKVLRAFGVVTEGHEAEQMRRQALLAINMPSLATATDE